MNSNKPDTHTPHFRDLVASERPLVLPGAHDALSAMLIQQAGFKAYFIGGFGMTAVTDGGIIVVPIRSGVGARLGINVGYLKFTQEPTWNPF